MAQFTESKVWSKMDYIVKYETNMEHMARPGVMSNKFLLGVQLDFFSQIREYEIINFYIIRNGRFIDDEKQVTDNTYNKACNNA